MSVRLRTTRIDFCKNCAPSILNTTICHLLDPVRARTLRDRRWTSRVLLSEVKRSQCYRYHCYRTAVINGARNDVGKMIITCCRCSSVCPLSPSLSFHAKRAGTDVGPYFLCILFVVFVPKRSTTLNTCVRLKTVFDELPFRQVRDGKRICIRRRTRPVLFQS